MYIKHVERVVVHKVLSHKV